MKILTRLKHTGLATGLFIGLAINNAYATDLNLSNTPLFLSNAAKPNFMIMLDNSGSMKRPMYRFVGTPTYTPGDLYDGIFDALKNYKYETDITIDTSAYPGVTIDTDEKGAFIEDNCTLGTSNCWSGEFMNWLTTRRIDASRKALVGGKVENRTPQTYRPGDPNTYYKIIANNETYDHGDASNSILNKFNYAYNGSDNYLPINTNTTLDVESPANDGDVSASYEPYAQLKLSNSITIDGSSEDEFNLAVIVPDEPMGIVQEIKDDVRLGVSFYRYDDDDNSTRANVYTGNSGSYSDGGTLRFKIPKNPFVRAPQDASSGFDLSLGQKPYRNLEGYIGTANADLVDAIEHYPLIWGSTPLAENLWELVQYFEQDTPNYTAGTIGFQLADLANPERDPYYHSTYNDKLNCTKSSTIIVTDGLPFRDTNIPGTLVDYDNDSNAGDSTGIPGNNDLIDDVAYWAHCDTSNAATCDINTGTRDLRTDTGMTGDQYLDVYVIAFADTGASNQVLQDTAANGGSGSAYDGSTTANFVAAIRDAAGKVEEKRASATGVAASSTQLNTGTRLFRSSFVNGQWSGQLTAFSLDTSNNATRGSVNATPVWETRDTGLIPAFGSRNIHTLNISTAAGAAFNTSLPASQIQLLRAGTESDNTNAALRISYLRGDTTNEEANATSLPLRDRVVGDDGTTPLIGDIVNSTPWFTDITDLGYSAFTGAEGTQYTAYMTALKALNSGAGRTDMVYVGANDGMLHGFRASDGQELLAYVPSFLFNKLANLTDTNYTHEYFVDGPVKTGDAYFPNASTSNKWRTVLVGTAGAGARGLFALEVTDPDNFGSSNVLWEVTNTFPLDTTGPTPVPPATYPPQYPDLGFTMVEPSIVRMANGQWAAIISNGYNSTSDNAVVYIIDIENGNKIAEFHTDPNNNTAANGMSSHIPVDIDGDQVVDYIYAGDLLGNLWKIDVTDGNANNWDFALNDGGSPVNPAPLFTAVDSSGTPQPITSKPQAGGHPTESGIMIYFGTGKYLESTDISNTDTQTFYAVYDDLSTNSPIVLDRATPASSDLVAQTITFDDGNYRIVSSNTVTYPSKKGWYLDVTDTGERMLSTPVLRAGTSQDAARIVFTTYAPDANPCTSGGTGWLMELNAVNGTALPNPVIDIDGDGDIDSADVILTVDTDGDGIADSTPDAPSGKKLDDIAPGGVTIVEDTDNGKEYKQIGKADGSIQTITESSTSQTGRQSWRQLK